MSERWSLVQFRENGSLTTRVGVLAEGKVHGVPAEASTLDLMDVIQRWDEIAPALRSMDVHALEAVPDAEVLAPLTYPRKVICAGANYYKHAEEMGTAPPDPTAVPFFFLKPPTTTVVGPHTDVVLPDDAQVDWEVELVAVIGRGGRHIDEASALDHVAGYTVANDLSARGLFPREDAVMAPFGWDWVQHKAHDGFCPVGPGITPSWLVADPQDLSLRLSVNGVVKQDSSTSDMVFGVARLISAASKVITLEAGDLILTGTPAGVGMPHGTFLNPGDVVVAEIDGLGVLENTMVKA
jgi:2-keto-4-pentenoate hydratase/2-oxohepta-3-ene-1,7-dioic acid hydratase in catechol pathway